MHIVFPGDANEEKVIRNVAPSTEMPPRECGHHLISCMESTGCLESVPLAIYSVVTAAFTLCIYPSMSVYISRSASSFYICGDRWHVSLSLPTAAGKDWQGAASLQLQHSGSPNIPAARPIGYTSSTGLRNSKNLVPEPLPGIGCCPPISRFVDAFPESNGAENLEFWSKVAYFERFGSDE